MLGARIKAYADERGLKYSAIAERANISLNTFSAMINEKRRITAEEYFAICEAFEVPVDFFYSKVS